MLTTILGYAGLALFFGCLLWAAVNDLCTMKIPNACVLLLLAGFVLVLPALPFTWVEVGDALVVALCVLVAGFVLFMLNVLGAGDGKLFAVLALWLGADGAQAMLVMAAIFGGVLAMILLAYRRRPLPIALITNPVASALHEQDQSMPFALAIAPAAAFALAYSAWAPWVPFITRF